MAKPPLLASKRVSNVYLISVVLARQDGVSRSDNFHSIFGQPLLNFGDVLAIARGTWAVYDGTAADQRGRGMVGQHGALTPEERQVPVIRLGAFSR